MTVDREEETGRARCRYREMGVGGTFASLCVCLLLSVLISTVDGLIFIDISRNPTLRLLLVRRNSSTRLSALAYLPTVDENLLELSGILQCNGDDGESFTRRQ